MVAQTGHIIRPDDAESPFYLTDQTRPDYIWVMVMRNISQAKAELSSLVEAVLQGKQVIIGKAGKPVAKLVPYGGSATPRRPGALKGKIKIAPDFDTLPDDLKDAFGA